MSRSRLAFLVRINVSSGSWVPGSRSLKMGGAKRIGFAPSWPRPRHAPARRATTHGQNPAHVQNGGVRFCP